MEDILDKEFEKIEPYLLGKEDLNKSESEEKTTVAVKLIEIIESNESIELFHNQSQDMFARLIVDNHHQIWKIKSSQFKEWLVKLYWEQYQKAPNSNSLTEALNVIQSKARFDGKQYTLFNRVAKVDDALWYDLADTEWKSVQITSTGWNIIEDSPIIFRRYQHQSAQVLPIRGGNIKKVLNFVNLQSEEHQILFLVYLVSCFIPEFPHPIPNIYGTQGSAKSSLSKVIRRVVDPSVIEVSELPKSISELIQKLSHHWCIVFDNVSYISDDISDLLCRAVTGTGFSKRELYTDDEDVIYNIKHCIALNGINLVGVRPDLLERGILFELERVPKNKRKQEQTVFKELQEELPAILGSIFDVLSRALSIYPHVVLDELPRMADFTVWGCAIAEAIGYSQNDFLNAYAHNRSIQNKEVINENIIAAAIIEFMFDQNSWEGTPQKLYEAIRNVAQLRFQMDIERDKLFPKTANVFSRRLNCLKPNLEEEGLKVFNAKGEQRKIHIQKISENIAETVFPLDNINSIDF